MKISDTGSRWEAEVDGRVVGVADYELRGSQLVFTHTVVEREVQGQGVATALVAEAVGDARRRGLDIVPQCSFVQVWMARHPVG